MTSGLKTLHNIDSAISQGRKAASNAARLPAKASQQLVNLRLEQMHAFEEIASERLELIEAGKGGALGYVDREAEELLSDHEAEITATAQKIDESLSRLEAFEVKRRAQEKAVLKAVDAYDKKVAAAEVKILKSPDYEAQLDRVEQAEATLMRAQEKLELSKEEVDGKGAPYRRDPYFSYLQGREFGTKSAKGWFLTKALDHWVAGLVDYRKAAEDYRRLIAIPVRLAAHVGRLETQAESAQVKLQALEDKILREEGVLALKEYSLAEQAELEGIDAEIEALEQDLQSIRMQLAALSAGESGPFRGAIDLLTKTLARKDIPSLRRLAAQTQSRDDDHAVEDLRTLAAQIEDAEDDQAEAKSLLTKYQKSLSDLEAVRSAFKKHRFDAPSSEFVNARLIMSGAERVLAGALSGQELWRQIKRSQRTVRRYSDTDFGGIDWTEGLRLPRNTGRRRSGGFGMPSGGGWGGGTQRRRTRIPRTPRQSLPKIRTPRGRSGGGFRTGGGF